MRLCMKGRKMMELDNSFVQKKCLYFSPEGLQIMFSEYLTHIWCSETKKLYCLKLFFLLKFVTLIIHLDPLVNETLSWWVPTWEKLQTLGQVSERCVNYPNPFRWIEASFLRSGYVIALCVETLFYTFMVLTGPMLNYTERILWFLLLFTVVNSYSQSGNNRWDLFGYFITDL